MTSVPGLRFTWTKTLPATFDGVTGVERFPVKTPAIDAVAGTAAETACTTIVAQPFMLVLTVEVAQIATPGEAATDVTVPVVLTVALVTSPDDQVTVVATPASA